jgi:nucleoporin p58/p45
MRELRTRVDQAVQDTIAATRLIDAFKAPAQQTQQGQLVQGQSSTWLKNYAGFPLEFVFKHCSFVNFEY